jgi:hypothetical protein
MNETLILGGIVVALWLGLLFLRVPSSIAFLSLLIGQLLSNEASADVYSFVGTVTHVSQLQYIQLALLLLPLLLTVLFLRGRVSKAKIVIEAVPMLLLAALTILLAAPLLSQLDILLDMASKDQVDAYKSIIVVAASVSGLLSAWLSYPKAHHDKKKRGKHHHL